MIINSDLMTNASEVGRKRITLTGQLKPLEVPEVLHCHLQNVCLFQFRVSGALNRQRYYNLTSFIDKSCGCGYIRTSFFRASMMRVFSWPRLSLMRARLRFSIIGLEDF